MNGLTLSFFRNVTKYLSKSYSDVFSQIMPRIRLTHQWILRRKWQTTLHNIHSLYNSLTGERQWETMNRFPVSFRFLLSIFLLLLSPICIGSFLIERRGRGVVLYSDSDSSIDRLGVLGFDPPWLLILPSISNFYANWTLRSATMISNAIRYRIFVTLSDAF